MPPLAGEVHYTLEFSGTSVSGAHPIGCPDLGSACSDPTRPAPIPYRHEVDVKPIDFNATVAIGLGHHLGLEARIPLRTIRSRVNFTTPGGAPYDPSTDGITDGHHENKTWTRIADPRVMFVAATESGAWAFSTRLGFTIPLGTNEADPFTAGRLGLAHQHFQWGSGVVSPVFGVGVNRLFAGFSISALATAQIPLFRNHHGYMDSHRFDAAAFASLSSRPLGLSWQGGLSFNHETREEWGGLVTDEGNLGLTNVLASLRVGRSLGPSSIGLSFSLPLHVNAVGGSIIDYPAIVGLSFSGAFLGN